MNMVCLVKKFFFIQIPPHENRRKGTNSHHMRVDWNGTNSYPMRVEWNGTNSHPMRVEWNGTK